MERAKQLELIEQFKALTPKQQAEAVEGLKLLEQYGIIGPAAWVYENPHQKQ